MSVNLFRLKQVDLREEWHHEAYDFTKWLAEGEYKLKVIREGFPESPVNGEEEITGHLLAVAAITRKKKSI